MKVTAMDHDLWFMELPIVIIYSIVLHRIRNCHCGKYNKDKNLNRFIILFPKLMSCRLYNSYLIAGNF